MVEQLPFKQLTEVRFLPGGHERSEWTPGSGKGSGELRIKEQRKTLGDLFEPAKKKSTRYTASVRRREFPVEEGMGKPWVSQFSVGGLG